MKKLLFIMLFTALTACSSNSIVNTSTLTPTLTPTLAPTPTPTEMPEMTRPFGNGLIGEGVLTLKHLEGQLGNFTFAEKDGYYEAFDKQGTKVENIKFYKDGTANLSYKSGGKTYDLWIAFEAISSKDNVLTVGLWDWENGAWSKTQLTSAENVINKQSHKFAVNRVDREIEKKLTATLFAIREIIKNEFKEEIQKEFSPDVQLPGTVEIVNWNKNIPGQIIIEINPSGELTPDHFTEQNYQFGEERPLQIALGDLNFLVELIDIVKDENTKQQKLDVVETVHALIVGKDAQGHTEVYSTLIDTDIYRNEVYPELQSGRRSVFKPNLFFKATPKYRYPYLSSGPSTMAYIVDSSLEALKGMGIPAESTRKKFSPGAAYPPSWRYVIIVLYREPWDLP